MPAFVRNKLKELVERDRWLWLKFVVVAISLGLIGKALLIGAVNGCGLHPAYAQFVPTIPMMALNFVAQRYLWKCQGVSFWSYVGGSWSAVYCVQFLASHGLFTLCTTVLGWQYLLVSSAIGCASALMTFAVNELKLLAKHSLKETVIA
ncbi:hypothetical protein KW801_01025 [Candidatus Saccharibacteria bacterium]|nr:hypothetical protein [Candidatus Saccharibacteria bacterium]